MKEIGGYFELELTKLEKPFLHSEGVLLNSGRHALEYILLCLQPSIKRIFLPYYTCEVVLQPIKRLGIAYEFYHININLEIENMPDLKEGEYILVNDYFGIKDEYIRNLPVSYQDHIILDLAQAWYAEYIPSFKSFYSPRKFFGIPDGGIALGINNSNLELSLEKDYSYQRFGHLLIRHELPAIEGYKNYRAIASSFSIESLKRMSVITENLLSSIRMDIIKEKRRENFQILHEILGDKNKIKIPSLNEFECPMIYPFLIENSSLRKDLIDHKVFIAQYWPDVIERVGKNTVEYDLTQNLLALPIDQRYGKKEMNYILNIILNN